MNNRYICKGKRKDNNEWVEGYLIQGNKTYIATTEAINYMVVSTSYMASIELVEVIPETVRQCTGLKERISYLEESIDCSRKEYNSLLQKLQQAKSEAIKEFAERLKRTAIGLEIGDDKKFKMTVVSTVAIDNLVREMTEVETNQRKEDKGNENHKNTHRKNICR